MDPGVTDQEIGDRIAAIRGEIDAIDTSGMTLSATILDSREQLSTLIDQRNTLLLEAAQLMADKKTPAWDEPAP